MIDSKFNALNIHRFDYKKCVILFNHFYSVSAGWPNWKDFFSFRRQPEVIREHFFLLFFFVNLFPIYIVGVAQLIPCDFSIFQSYRRAHDSQ
jgi:hypothetical protein